jgi:signal transduction histidine kinase
MSHAATRLDTGSQNFERLYESLLAATTTERIFALALDATQELLGADSAFVLLPDSEFLRTVSHRELAVGRAADAVISMVFGTRVLGKFVLRFDQPRDFSEADVVAARLIAMHAVTSVLRLKERESMAMVVHELNGPLQSIRAAVEMLRGDDPGCREQAMEIIGRSARSQSRLFEDLLSLARIQTGKLKLKLEEVNLVGVVRDAVEAAFAKAMARGTIVSFEGPPGRVLILGDAGRLNQIFWNLLSNAVRFSSPDGRVQVRVFETAGHVDVSVADNGIGIAPDALPLIFEPFHHGGGGTQNREEGLGLGLAIAKQFVEMHDGLLIAESAGLGKGSTFTVRLNR